jgi:hypothetical protein
MTTRSQKHGRHRAARIVATLLALIAAVSFAASSAHAKPPLERSFELPEITLSDAYLSTACGVDVSATVSGVYGVEAVLR